LLGSAGPSASVGLQLVSEAISHILPEADWLPVLSANLDLTNLILQYGSQNTEVVAASGGLQAAGDLGLLHLAVLVARRRDGAQMLHDQGALDKLTALSRHLLSTRGGGLAPFSSLEIPGTTRRGVACGW
jgi:hypothetical protein